jgi:hypothetical protein
MNHTVCPNRKNHPRIGIEACKWRVLGDDRRKPDRECLKKVDGMVSCPTARKILEEANASNNLQK